MITHDQLELDQAGARPFPSSERSATIKNILLHVQDDESLATRLDNALAIARACSAHLSCLHVTPIEAYVAFDSFGGAFVMNDVIKALDDQETNLHSRIKQRLMSEDVSWDYDQVTGSVAARIINRAALSDLIVTGRAAHRGDFAGPAIGQLGDLLCQARTPLLIPSGSGSICDPSGPAVIAWDGSYEAANAVRSALGLLRLASNVQILTIEEKEEMFPSTRLLEYLSRHGIHAELSVEPTGPDSRDPAFVAGMLAEWTRVANAYLVMGGFSHSRVGEFIFGGVTRTLLSEAPIPIVIAR